MPWLSANCMNFVSQCIWAGFGGSNSSDDINAYYGMDREGTNDSYKWYTNSKGTSISSSWQSCKGFRTYVDNSNNSTGKGLVCTTSSVAYNSDIIPGSTSTLVGSAIQTKGLDSNGNEVSLGHVVFVNAAQNCTRNGVYFTSYNTNYKNKLLGSRYPSSTSNTKNNLLVITPKTFRDGENGLRLWATLFNAMPTNSTLSLQGYSNTTCKTFKLEIYNPSGTLVNTSTFSNTSSITKSYTFNGIGAWRIVLTGTDSSGTQKTFTYTVRTY